MENPTSYTMMAAVLEYPDAEYPTRITEAVDALSETHPAAGRELAAFAELLPVDDLWAMQELFVRSFDVQAVTTLGIGYVHFGDDYKRGELLANLNREHNAVGNKCGHELSDHLPNVLRLLPLLADEKLRIEMVQKLLVPSVQMMISEFSPERVAQKDEAYKKHYKTLIDIPAVPSNDGQGYTLYRFVLRAIFEMFKQDYVILEREVPRFANDFLASLTQENEIEEGAGCGST